MKFLIKFIALVLLENTFASFDVGREVHLPSNCNDPSITRDGEYLIYPYGSNPVLVYCEVSRGGWTSSCSPNPVGLGLSSGVLNPRAGGCQPTGQSAWPPFSASAGGGSKMAQQRSCTRYSEVVLDCVGDCCMT